ATAAPRAAAPVAESSVSAAPAAAAQPAADADWAQIMAAMNLQGIVRQLAAHCALLGRQGALVKLSLDPEGEHFRTAQLEERLTQALCRYYGEDVRLEITVAQAAAIDTPARQMQVAAQDRQEGAREAIENDPNIRAMQDVFGATVTPESIRPAD